MQWVGHPDYILFIYAHGFKLGLVETLYLAGPTGRYSLSAPLSNEDLIVAVSGKSRLLEGDYDVDAGSVNGIQRLGKIKLTRSCTQLVVLQPTVNPDPFNICVLPNNKLLASNGDTSPDVVLTDVDKFNAALVDVFRSLIFSSEDILRTAYSEAVLRVSVVVPSIVASFKLPLVAEATPNLAKPIQKNIQACLRQAKIDCDVALIVHGSRDYTRASAKFTVDDPTSKATSFEIDGRKFLHYRKTKIAGAATISYYSFDISHTPLHEFGHAASEINNGQVIDLYNDEIPNSPFVLNKRCGRPIPPVFVRYNEMTYKTDPGRNHLGYQNDWISFHPQLAVDCEPNLMDDYWQAHSDPQNCKFDKLTHDWLLARLRAKGGK